jgi:6-phosphogluconate dehydrogenase
MEPVYTKAAVGVIGLAVMGANLARNFERNGYRVAVYNRTTSVTDDFMKEFGSGNHGGFVGTDTLEGFVSSLESPRRILVMVKAGDPVDKVVESLLPLLATGDIIMDGGNSHFEDTARRVAQCESKGIGFMGVGVSGGEEGALWGPSIMPGGTVESWKAIEPLMKAIAAKADGPCVTFIGPQGSGHFVKMVHNGIEYADMQLIAESYDVLRRVCHLEPPKLADLYERWNQGPLQSFLIEITSKIFKKHDELADGYLVDKVLDKAEQKGTGKWTAQCALDQGVVVSVIDAAVTGRILSSLKDQRVANATVFPGEISGKDESVSGSLLEAVHDALLVAKIISYAQGMELIATVSRTRNWNLSLSEIARIWKGGCIIRARMLDEIQAEFARPRKEHETLLSGALGQVVMEKVGALRQVVSKAVSTGIPVPALSAALAYFDSIRTPYLPQNLTQAQRDFFGAHTYHRTDREGVFHSSWE